MWSNFRARPAASGEFLDEAGKAVASRLAAIKISRAEIQDFTA
jgi:hypothetical protein